MTDLQRLIEAVEGGASAAVIDFYTPLDWADGSGDLGLVARGAFNGSLDAAKALHEALLAGWSPSIGQNVHHGYWFAHLLMAKNGSVVGDYGGYAIDNPARAWLIAILKAYEAHQ